MKFGEFVGKKKRNAQKQLGIVKEILSQQGLMVKDHLEDEEPYIFLHNPNRGTQFEGVRIYKIGDFVCYRVQNEENTHPYGKAYSLDIEDMFQDIISDDDYDQEKAGQEVMKSVVEELRKFFDKSAAAEKEMLAGEFDRQRDPLGKVVISPTGTDYANNVTNTNPRNNY